MTLQQPALLALADGTLFRGVSIGVSGQTIGEVVFNTMMSGYQEILTDPSAAGQLISFTYPHIGNTGCNPDDEESPRFAAAGLIIRSLSPVASSWRARESLESYLHRHRVVGIAGIDTRRLTRLLREGGTQTGCILAGPEPDEEAAVSAARRAPGIAGRNLVPEVTAPAVTEWHQASDGTVRVPHADTRHVVVYDFGARRSTLRLLVDHDCRLTLVPAGTAAADVLGLEPDGVLLSSGPGDPNAAGESTAAVRDLLGSGIPVFGIGYGHQVLALASGARVVRMPVGHHGSNHPVADAESGTVYITRQNHEFVVAEDGLPEHLVPTHRSLFDGSLQGVRRTDAPAFGFQGHPVQTPGAHDIAILFRRFVDMMATPRREGR